MHQANKQEFLSGGITIKTILISYRLNNSYVVISGSLYGLPSLSQWVIQFNAFLGFKTMDFKVNIYFQSILENTPIQHTSLLQPCEEVPMYICMCTVPVYA